MATLQEGQSLLDRIRKAALLCTYSTARHATTSACYAIERLLQLLRDKWRKLDELWMRRLVQLQQCLQLALADHEATRVSQSITHIGLTFSRHIIKLPSPGHYDGDVCLFLRLFVCLLSEIRTQNAAFSKTKQLSAVVSVDDQ